MRELRLYGRIPPGLGIQSEYRTTVRADGSPAEVIPPPPYDPNISEAVRQPSLPETRIRVPDDTQNLNITIIEIRMDYTSSPPRAIGRRQIDIRRPVSRSPDVDYTPTETELAGIDYPGAAPPPRLVPEGNFPLQEKSVSIEMAIGMVLGGVAVGYLLGRSMK